MSTKAAAHPNTTTAARTTDNQLCEYSTYAKRTAEAKLARTVAEIKTRVRERSN
jgi:hypothetical protein